VSEKNKQQKPDDPAGTAADNTPENDENVLDLSDYDTGDDPADRGDAANRASTDSKMHAELEKAKNDYLYLRADFDNYKRSAIKERSDMVKYGCERLIVDLLNVLDTFDHALEMEITPENIGSFKEGVEMLRAEFQNTLGRHGVTALQAMGQPFDPNYHEALSSEPTSEIPAGHISKVFKNAYKLHDRLIRPAQVVVAMEPKAPGAGE
jgi:molecular chaperone GrpE